MSNQFIKTERHQRFVELAEQLAVTFKDTADQYDRSANFPFEHFKKLRESGYPAFPVPTEYGGEDINLYELILLQETLGQGDPATALSIGWHMGILYDLKERREWDEDIFEKLCLEIVKDQVIINRAQTEPKTGSPTRGGTIQTAARKMGDKWILDGHKTFMTLAPDADYFLVNAAIENDENGGGFLVDRDRQGVIIKETWDTLGMRSTRSDDLYLEDVHLPLKAKVETIDTSKKEKKLPPAWLLHIPATYSGIALSARDEVVKFAKTYQPNSLDSPIKTVPHVRQKIAEIDLELLKARSFMYYAARDWDEAGEERYNMRPQLAAVKHSTVNAAIKAVDLAMRIVGGQSIFKSLPFERFYRDVRAGLHNPPSDDETLAMLAHFALDDED